jgi:hypothetical protein
VVRGLGNRAIVGVRAGARLGTITVHPTHARIARRLARRWVAARYVARARKGVPIGAGKFGRVRTKPPRSKVPRDLDRDGIPNPLDIDDDGDMTLDNLDRTPHGRTQRARAATHETLPEFSWEFNLRAEIAEIVNANAAGVTPQQVDDFLKTHSDFTVGVVPGDSAELDCAGSNQHPPRPIGLGYCRAGGTGIVQGRRGMGPAQPTPFPGPPRDNCCFDLDGDGFGSIGRNGLHFFPRATTAEIRTGDVLIQHASTKGVGEDKCPSLRPACISYAVTLEFVPATSPALVAYSDGQGNCAKVVGSLASCATEFSYPVPADPAMGVCPPPGPPCSGPGTRKNPFPVKPGPPNGDIVVTVTFWRPQRARLATDPQADTNAGDSNTWTDIGRLNYGFGVGNQGQDCPTSAFSTTDPNVEIRPGRETEPGPEPGLPGIIVDAGQFDKAADRPANPKNTLTYTVNLTKCLAVPTDAGPGPEPWNPGETKGAAIAASDGSSAATLVEFFFRRQAG